MAKDFNNRLITPELEKAMQDYPLYSQDSKKKDAVCIAVFFIGNARWYILEGQRENDDFVLFGIVVGSGKHTGVTQLKAGNTAMAADGIGSIGSAGKAVENALIQAVSMASVAGVYHALGHSDSSCTAL